MAALFAAGTPAIVTHAWPQVLVGGPVIRQSLSYGPAAQQRIELFTRARAGRAPLIVYVHGGGWSAGNPGAGSGGAEPEHWTGKGYAYATIGYRLVPAATVEQQMDDLAAGIAMLRRQKSVDRGRIILIGHSSGGHLAALLGTDPSYLVKAGIPFDSLKAVVLLDAAAIDIAPIMAMTTGGTIGRYYLPAFGTDPARQSALSPMKQTEPPNAPAWLMLNDSNNMLAGLQDAQLAAALIGAGAKEASVQAITGTTHIRLNDEIGQPDNPATELIDAFLARTLPETRQPRFR